MTKEEYVERMKNEEDWAPGWDAIEEEFERLYPGQEPAHYGTKLETRAMFGGEEYLDGYSIYDAGNGVKHIVTFGMTELYTDEEAFGDEYSRWGYEMTMKLKADSHEDCLWALNVLGNLAKYTYTSQNYYDPEEVVPGNGTSIHYGTESKITALITVRDTTAQGKDTVHGRVDFIQFVGITEKELNAIKEDFDNLKILIERMKKDNPDLVTDMDRTTDYL